MSNHKTNEYLMLREEIMYDLKAQQKCSTFAITATITIIGLALQTTNSVCEMYLLPYIVLLLSAVKVNNYKTGMQKIVGYMLANLESPDGFYWENSLYILRKNDENNTNTIFKNVRSFLETQEFTFMAVICLILYIIMLIRAKPHFIVLRAIICVAPAVFSIVIIFRVSMNYWNLNVKDVEYFKNTWNQIKKQQT